MPVVDLNGISLSYQDKGAGRPVVMLMGMGSSGRVWHLHQQPALIAAGHRVITVDNRGVPPTSECADGITVADMAADVIALAAHLGLDRFDLVGTSLGARIAIDVAATKPDLVGRVVLLAARSRAGRLHATFDAGERDLVDEGVVLPSRYYAATTAMWNLSPHTLFDRDKVGEWLDILEFATQPPGPGIRAQMDIGDDPDLSGLCARVTAPTLVVSFTDDLVAPPHLGREIADWLPDAWFTQVDGGGHYGYLERPEVVNGLLTEFLAVPPRPPVTDPAAGESGPSRVVRIRLA
ncbi:alpha/beta hydrolase [Actinokineospora auranticolor]|uniref:Pimeloyl-ACP methyl ester carboxylesterase n=1 Tax=Actinokineospora auranticolor TaxID=155976 RepID=A0A2S6GEI5_9PSEU|nr:alpha/beta hydrolase [Actinokineospora auranticolor]PPK63647.1 pimeloyl-ACP methyl ester carboxylesterase [Actinokineospora auranticolor]